MKQIHPWMRNIFYVGSLLSFVAGIQLFVLSERTDTYFAWTIQSPLTAATFGAFYFGTMVFGFMSGRERLWAHVRAPAIGLLVFVAGVLAATLLHLDKFHLASQNLLTLSATRIWMLIYVLLPLAIILSLVQQARLPGVDPEQSSRLPSWIRIFLMLHGIAGIAVGIPLFIIPQAVIPFWSWPLTQLTSQVVSAWLISFSVVDFILLWENDWRRARVTAVSYLTSGLLAAIALVRYTGEVQWFSVGNLGYLAYLLFMLAFGVIGWLQTQSAPQ